MNTEEKAEVVVLIPALNPDEKLEQYVHALLKYTFAGIVLVNDGSRAKCQPIFEQLEKLDLVTVLHHEENKGKGRALKTGFAYCLEHFPEAVGVVTADSDGQHSPKDTWNVALALQEKSDGLWLGTRDFTQEQVPFKSRYGNQITTCVFAFLYGKYIHDTQTGLRGIAMQLLPDLIELPGERFEYEIRMLIYASKHKIPICEKTIETIYIDDNKETHFNPLKDSLRIYKVMFQVFLKYLFSSLSASLIDMGLFAVMHYFVLAAARGITSGQNVVLSTVAARIISSLYNFKMNQTVVFESSGRAFQKAVRYYLLAIVQMGCSAGLVYILTIVLKWWALPAKIIVDTLLFCVSYQIQQKWIFVDK